MKFFQVFRHCVSMILSGIVSVFAFIDFLQISSALGKLKDTSVKDLFLYNVNYEMYALQFIVCAVVFFILFLRSLDKFISTIQEIRAEIKKQKEEWEKKERERLEQLYKKVSAAENKSE